MHFFRRILSLSSELVLVLVLLLVTAALAIGAMRNTREPNGTDTVAISSASNLDSLIRDANSLSQSLADISDSNRRVLDRISTKPASMPTAGWLSSRYANRRLHPISNKMLPHRGIDVAAPMGTVITAPGAGRVTRVARAAGYGLMLEIDHGDGIVTRYGHCSRVMVKKGMQVLRGHVIATVGNSGLSTGPHLHYEILYRGIAVDPLTFID
jgi:murein DD-endopeptidase MepM/ murein hydrolase activator NlpD